MKVLLFCIIASITVSVVLGGCYSQDECKDGYCCTGGITPWLKGVCRRMATEGKLCDPNPPNTEKYFLRCPCVKGLKCLKTENVISKKSPLCVKQ